MISKWLQLIGLFFDIWGAWVLANDIRLTNEEIERESTWDGIKRRSEQKRRDKVNASRGFCLLGIGFSLQAVSTVVSFWD